MCGLVGVFAFEPTSSEVLLEPVRSLSARMVRRGPDDEGHWSDGRCALGFRRLSILDVSPAGHQPMLTAEGRHALVFNGEIYNFRELRDELASRGLRPRSTGDAEVLLLALREWGPEALRRLNGMFALAFYDLDQKRLLIARDHAGIKPLYYAMTDRGLVFASQYDQLLAHPWCRDVAVDREGLGLYLRFGFLPAPYGLHAGAGQLEAGQWLQIDEKRVPRRAPYYTLPSSKATLRGMDAIDELDATLVRAVKRQLVSDVPIGVLLSGGIDSPLVAAQASREHPGIQAFTIGVEDPSLDETDDARRYAAEIGVTHVVERVSERDVLGLLDDVVTASTEPAADYSMFPTLLVCRRAQRDVKVVLSGDGGDELFWGYPSRFGSAIELAPYFRWPRAARFAAIAARRYLGRGSANRDVIRYDSIGRLYQRKHTLLQEADLDRIFPSLPPIPTAFTAFHCESTDPDEVAEWTRRNELRIHLARVLAKVDRASMYSSLEVRVPLLDREVIDVAMRTDWRTCFDLRERVGKRPLRALLERRVRHHTRSKRGFTVPIATWLSGPLRPLVREHLLGRRELLGLPLQTSALIELEAKLRAGDTSKAWGLWLLLSLALWERKYGGRS